MSRTSREVAALRKLMERHKVEAYVVPSTDPHQSEYVPEFWQRRKFISGFTGSAGDIVITRRRAGLWTDSRYWLQAAQQLDRRTFKLFKAGLPRVPSWQEWAMSQLRKGETLGVDPRLLSRREYAGLKAALEKQGRRLKSIHRNLVDAVWKDRPAPPLGRVEILGRKQTGESTASKLSRLRRKMKAEGADIHIVTQLDSIAWLFNIRGSDVEFNPFVIAYAAVTPQSASLFIERKKVTPGLRKALKGLARIKDYDDFGPFLRRLRRGRRRVWADEASVSQWVFDEMGKNTDWILKPSPLAMMKAVKNSTEIRHFRSAHIHDGGAMVRFLFWLEKAVRKGTVTEISAESKLLEYRSGHPSFKGPSFKTISAYRGHGAVVHYAATTETNSVLRPRGIYLIDSGGQYTGATTDITRTVSLGHPTAGEKEAFTRVLKGLIGLTRTRFPRGTSGKQLDTLARLPLWEAGMNYSHGTGHGVGANLGVHEGPQAISYYRCTGVALEPGMVTTIEPALYREGKFGIRTENIVLVVPDQKRASKSFEFLALETLTLCPIDLGLVKKSLLTAEETAWINDYHRRVRTMLSPLLSREETRWLARKTRKL